jgi:hypothetical protein
MQYLNLTAQIMELAIDDSHLHIDIIKNFVQTKDQMPAGTQKGNVDLMMTIFDTLVKTEYIEKVNGMRKDLVNLVGETKVGSNFIITLFKVLYKLMMASGLAIVQQTQSAIATIK